MELLVQHLICGCFPVEPGIQIFLCIKCFVYRISVCNNFHNQVMWTAPLIDMLNTSQFDDNLSREDCPSFMRSADLYLTHISHLISQVFQKSSW